jgi:hypothetical protein
MNKYLYKCLYILANFASCNDYNLIPKLFQPEIVEILKVFLISFKSKLDCLFQLIKIFQYISNEPVMLNLIENIGLIPVI